MSKLDEMRRMTAGNVDDSMGVGRAPVHGAPASAGPSAPARWQGVARSKNAAEIPLGRIGPDPDQPREEFEPAALGRLAESLKARGQIQPISVRWSEERVQYIIVSGERRWRAAGLAGMATMSCVVLDRPVPQGELLALQLVENLLREDLKPIEQARAYRALMDGNGWSVSQVARELAVDHSSVSRALALLTLPEGVQGQVEQGALSPATAYEVSKLDDPAVQREVAARVVAEGLSRAETVEEVRRAGKASAKGRGGKARPRPTSRILRGEDGYRVTVERKKGVDPDGLVRALRVALAMAEAELDSGLAGDMSQDAA